MAAPDPDPLYVGEDAASYINPRTGLGVATGGNVGADDYEPWAAHFRARPTKPKSPAVILYLAVILVAIATGAIIALLWWGLR